MSIRRTQLGKTIFMLIMVTILGTSANAAETLKVGLSVPLSGAGASWGIGLAWTAKQAAKHVNDAGGIKVQGKQYMLEVVDYDNKYNAAEGAKVAQTLLMRDNVQYIVGSIGTAPVQALQSLSERKGVLLYTASWGSSIKGPKFPLTFTLMNTPNEILGHLYAYVKSAHPEIKTVALLDPNDATGQETTKEAKKRWEAVGVKILTSDFYERGTTEFQPIATKFANLKPDVIDLSTAPPADAGAIFKELKVLGWKGVKVLATGSAGDVLQKVGGDAVDGTYMGSAANFDGPMATPLQRRLNKAARDELHDPLNVLTIASWDTIMSLKTAMEKTNSLDPKVIAETLPKIVFESSWGLAAFGGAATYGSPQQILIPMIVTQLKGKDIVELKRIIPPELEKRLAGAK